MHRGYIKLWRKLSDNPLWVDSKFTPGQAWIDLILLANHKLGHIRVRGIKVDVPRGFCGWSQVALAERWKWSRGKVIRFLDELETIQQIVQQKNNVTTLIKIVNYDEYQTNGTTNETADGQQTDSRRYTNKNDKNDKNINMSDKFLPDAENIYNFYIKHVPLENISGLKQPCLNNLKQWLKKYNQEELLDSIKNYSNSRVGQKPRFNKKPSNFFGRSGDSRGFFKGFLNGVYKSQECVEGLNPPPANLDPETRYKD